MEDHYKLRNVNELAGVLVFVFLILAAIGLFLSARAQQWFARTHELTVQLPAEGAFGLKEGSDVQILGVSAGWVDEIRVEDESLVARIRIQGKFRDLVRVDSVVRLQRTLVVAGDTFVEIDRGTGSAVSDERLVARAPRDFVEDLDGLATGLREEIGSVLERAEEALGNWSEAASGLTKMQRDAGRILERFETVLEDIEEQRGLIGRLISDPGLADGLEELVGRAEEAMNDLRGVLDNLERGTVRLPEIGDALADEALGLPTLVLQARQTLREIETFFEGLQRHWLFRGAMDPSGPRPRIPPERIEGGRP